MPPSRIILAGGIAYQTESPLTAPLLKIGMRGDDKEDQAAA
jgi:hypothetical protein